MNAKKQSTVKSVTGAGTYKEFFSFEYTMEDGTILKANHKENTPRFPIGSVVDYEITFTNQYGNLGKLSKPEDGQGQQGSIKSYVDNTKGMKIGHAITNAVNMYIALGSSDLDRKEAIKDYAKLIYQISEELNNEL